MNQITIADGITATATAVRRISVDADGLRHLRAVDTITISRGGVVIAEGLIQTTANGSLRIGRVGLTQATADLLARLLADTVAAALATPDGVEYSRMAAERAAAEQVGEQAIAERAAIRNRVNRMMSVNN